MIDFCRNFNIEIALQILIYRCLTIGALDANFAHICRDRRPRRSGNKGRLLSKCRASFLYDIFAFVLGPPRTSAPTGLYVIFAGCPYRNNSINPNLEAGDS